MEVDVEGLAEDGIEDKVEVDGRGGSAGGVAMLTGSGFETLPLDFNIGRRYWFLVVVAGRVNFVNVNIRAESDDQVLFFFSGKIDRDSGPGIEL